jgi:hypothetical protein
VIICFDSNYRLPTTINGIIFEHTIQVVNPKDYLLDDTLFSAVRSAAMDK